MNRFKLGLSALIMSACAASIPTARLHRSGDIPIQYTDSSEFKNRLVVKPGVSKLQHFEGEVVQWNNPEEYGNSHNINSHSLVVKAYIDDYTSEFQRVLNPDLHELVRKDSTVDVVGREVYEGFYFNGKMVNKKTLGLIIDTVMFVPSHKRPKLKHTLYYNDYCKCYKLPIDTLNYEVYLKGSKINASDMIRDSIRNEKIFAKPEVIDEYSNNAKRKHTIYFDPDCRCYKLPYDSAINYSKAISDSIALKTRKKK